MMETSLPTHSMTFQELIKAAEVLAEAKMSQITLFDIPVSEVSHLYKAKAGGKATRTFENGSSVTIKMLPF